MLSEIIKIFSFPQNLLLKKYQKALDEAYEVALKIKIIQNKQFYASDRNNKLINCFKINRTARSSFSDCLTFTNRENIHCQLELKKYLEIITLKILEFEPVLSMFDTLENGDCYLILHKLKTIDDVFVQNNIQNTNFLNLTNLEYQEGQIKSQLEDTSVVQAKISETVDRLLDGLSIESKNNIKTRIVVLFFVLFTIVIINYL